MRADFFRRALQALAPQYEEAATSLANQSIKLAKVDCTVETELCSSYGVSGEFASSDCAGERGKPRTLVVCDPLTLSSL